MPAKVRMPNGNIFAIDDMKWTSEDDPTFAEQLNARVFAGINMAIDPDPDEKAATLLADKTGGVVFDHQKFMTRVEGRIY